jgi:hypothetical protein
VNWDEASKAVVERVTGDVYEAALAFGNPRIAREHGDFGYCLTVFFTAP